MLQPKVAAVILNTNRRDDTLACLETLRRNDYPNLAILVLDNASTDGSVEAIRSAFPNVEIISLKDNRGYAGNNNVGISAALARGAEWVLVLNEDTLLAPDCISLLVAEGERDSRIGIVGPMVYHADEPNVIQSAGGWMDERWQAGHIGQNETDVGQFPYPRDVAWVSGCAIMVRSSVINQVGMLDERFFYYWEETEWCVRARQKDWRIVHVPAAKLWHKGVKRDYRPAPSVAYYGVRNHFMMLAKHHAPPTAWLSAWAQTLRTLASYTIRPKWRDKRAHRDAMWRGTVDFLQGRTGKMPTR
ncbi:MAG: glycosyltransferase family 2 protein [Anaerolineae bacterium]|nr:glycosyltransferase family 2 protein [Candidatus Roseilinea sp.]MDW8448417.1 glycosyltransferase family 2 protein [Anaerolineae bacterium]